MRLLLRVPAEAFQEVRDRDGGYFFAYDGAYRRWHILAIHPGHGEREAGYNVVGTTLDGHQYSKKFDALPDAIAAVQAEATPP